MEFLPFIMCNHIITANKIIIIMIQNLISMQVANTEKVNSISSTCVFCYFKAEDTSRNLQLALQQYQQQVETISSTKWQ